MPGRLAEFEAPHDRERATTAADPARPARPLARLARRGGARDRAESASRACSTRCASPAPNSPRCARSPGSPISPISSSTTCRRRRSLESKSLKLFLGSFRNHGAFHEDCTLTIAAPAGRGGRAALAAHRRLLVSARRHPDRRVLPDRRAAGRAVAARSRCRALSRPRLSAPDDRTRSARRSATEALALRVRRGRLCRGAARPTRRATTSREFLARGYHGDMGWLADTAARRGDPQTLWPEARTVVVLGLNYGGDDDGADRRRSRRSSRSMPAAAIITTRSRSG